MLEMDTFACAEGTMALTAFCRSLILLEVWEISARARRKALAIESRGNGFGRFQPAVRKRKHKSEGRLDLARGMGRGVNRAIW